MSELSDAERDLLIQKARATAQVELETVQGKIKSQEEYLKRVNAEVLQLRALVPLEEEASKKQVADVRKRAEADMEQIAAQVEAARQGLARLQQQESRDRQKHDLWIEQAGKEKAEVAEALSQAKAALEQVKQQAEQLRVAIAAHKERISALAL
jgi:hypothetical protein